MQLSIITNAAADSAIFLWMKSKQPFQNHAAPESLVENIKKSPALFDAPLPLWNYIPGSGERYHYYCRYASETRTRLLDKQGRGKVVLKENVRFCGQANIIGTSGNFELTE